MDKYEKSDIDRFDWRGGSDDGGSASGKLGGSNDQSAAAQKDYDRLTGTWQLTRAVVRKAGSRKCVAKKQS